MEFQRKVPLEQIENPSDVAIANHNLPQKKYEKCFNKLEFKQGMIYIVSKVVETIDAERSGEGIGKGLKWAKRA